MRNPKRTLAYLDELQECGFTDQAFSHLHHFREKGEQHPISTHRAYCEKTDLFRDDGNNERVQIRLELVLKYFKEYFRDPGVFAELADAAYILVPPL